MSSSERRPLLSNENDNDAGPATEASPLLSSRRSSETNGHDDSTKHDPDASSRFRWPSIIAMLGLAVVVVVVMVLGFVVPPAVQTYAEKAAVVEPTGLSLESLTADGLRARIQVSFRLDGSRVSDGTARRIGRFATSIVRALDTKETKLQVHLPDYGNALLGTAVIPPLTISLVDGHNTNMDFVADLSPGDGDTVRQLVNDWLDGKLEKVKVTGSAALEIRTGIFPLGKHNVVESMVFEAKELPTMPDYKIEQLNITDVPSDDGQMAIGAEVSITVHNDYPIGLTVPSLGFEILVPNCEPSESHIKVATAITEPIDVKPQADVKVDANGIIRSIPDSLTTACPLSELSPLDNFIKHYLDGESAKIFVRGQKSGNPSMPDWVVSLLSSISVPLDFPGKSFDDAIRNISVTDVDFKLPNPFANPNDPDGKPRVSGTIQVLAALPEELKVDIGVESLRATSDVFYEGRKLGELNLRHWEKAQSTKVDDNGEELMRVIARIVNVPLDITDGDVFSDVMQELLFGDDDISLDISSLVDAKVATVLGNLVLKGVPAKGMIPVKQLPGKSFTSLKPHISDLVILNTSRTSVHIQASVDLENPTPYTAKIPFANIHVYQQGYLIGDITAKDLDFKLGNNTNKVVVATLDPVSFSGEEGHKAARKLLSDYLSGKNTTLTMRTHRGSIPTVPVLGESLSRFNITLPTPRIKLPGDNKGHNFIQDATFHIFASAATFNLASPLTHNTIHIERINATALYNHTEPIGHILYDESFDAKPGLTPTPMLPVTWSLGSVGYDKLMDALGGTLKLDAVAEATLRIGNWVESVHYEGKGIGARVKL